MRAHPLNPKDLFLLASRHKLFMFSKKKYIVGVLIALTIFFVGFLSFLSISKNNQLSGQPAQRIADIDAIYTLKLADDRVLMGAFYNVSVGKIIRQADTLSVNVAPGKSLPVTQFSVMPILNIKGDLSNSITVDQTGGYQDGILY